MSSISSITNQIFRNYDRNGDGQIAVRPGHGFEGSHVQTDRQTSFDRDIITVTRYSNDKLFAAADKDGNGLVSRAELANTIKLFDKNEDGKLTNSGPFWNRKGEMRDFEKAYPERAQILEQHYIPHPPKPPVYPGHPNLNPGFPNQPNFPHHIPRAYAGMSVGVHVG